MTTMPMTGGCLCGAVRYALTSAPTAFGACHCQMCRRFSGGVMMGVEVADADIDMTGEDAITTYVSSDWAERGFCGTCGSALYWRMTVPGPMAGTRVLCAGTLDDLDRLTFDHEVYIDAKPDAYAFAGDRTRMTEADIMAMVADTQEGNAR